MRPASSLALSPLVLLAACGGGGGTEPLPAPPTGGTPSPTPAAAQPDSVTPAPGTPTATGNVLANDAPGASVAAIALPGGTTGAVGQPLQGQLGQLTIQSNGSFSYAIGNGSANFTRLAEGQTATETFVYTPVVGGVAGTPQTLVLTVTGLNDTPTAADDAGGSLSADQMTTSGNVLANDRDPDTGAALAVTSVRAGTGQLAQGVQGAKATGLPAVSGTYGTLTMQSDGSFSYSLDASDPDFRRLLPGETASETFTYTVSDGKLSTTATLAFMVVGTNNAPIAKDDGGELIEKDDGELHEETFLIRGNVLTNDSDPEGAALTVTHVAGQVLTPDLDPYDGASVPTTIYTGNVAAVTGTYGSLYIREDGEFSYVLRNDDPDTDALLAGQAAEETFTYTVRDASGLTSTANIRIKISGVTDAISVSDTIEVSEADAPTVLTGNIFANDRDATPSATIKSVLEGSFGSPIATPFGTFTIQPNGDYSFALAANAATNAIAAGTSGTATLNLTVNLKTGGMDQVPALTIKINGVNDTPAAMDDAAAITEDAAVNTVSGNVRTNDRDPDTADVLTVAAVAGGGAGQPRQGTYGSVVINANGAYVYTLDNGDPDTDALAPGQTAFDDFTYTVSDGKGGTATAVLRVTVTGAPNVITGTAGNDVLDGTALPDALSGLDGDDVLSGRGGGDRLDGGNGTDTASYGSATAGVTVNLSNVTQNAGDAAGDTYVSIERIVGSGFADTLIGDGAANTLEGGAGGDIIDGGTGFASDTASYASASAGVTINLKTPSLNTGDAAGDTLISIERVIGSDFDDVLVGLDAHNILDGGAGDDRLTGGALGDHLTGGVGADILDGFDTTSFANTASYFRSAAGVNVNLAAGTGTGADAEGDQLLRIDNVIGSLHSDTLTGSARANQLRGGDGVDVLAGLDGDDALAGGSGGDQIDGGDGLDSADYSASLEAVSINLATGTVSGGEAAGDVLSDIEGVIGSGLDDVLVGDAGINALLGGSGSDRLTGGAGADRFIYDLLLLNGDSSHYDTITDFETGVDQLHVFNLGSAGSFDFISGDNPVATSSSPTFLYNTSTGVLSYSASSLGFRTVAVFESAPPLEANDIVLI